MVKRPNTPGCEPGIRQFESDHSPQIRLQSLIQFQGFLLFWTKVLAKILAKMFAIWRNKWRIFGVIKRLEQYNKVYNKCKKNISFVLQKYNIHNDLSPTFWYN